MCIKLVVKLEFCLQFDKYLWICAFGLKINSYICNRNTLK